MEGSSPPPAHTLPGSEYLPSPGVLVTALTDGEEDSSTMMVPGLPPNPEAKWTWLSLLHPSLLSRGAKDMPPHPSGGKR